MRGLVDAFSGDGMNLWVVAFSLPLVVVSVSVRSSTTGLGAAFIHKSWLPCSLGRSDGEWSARSVTSRIRMVWDWRPCLRGAHVCLLVRWSLVKASFATVGGWCG